VSRVCLVCQNIDCKSRGSEQVMSELQKRITDQGLSDVEVKPYMCFGACQDGPNVVLYPEIIHDPRIIPLDRRPHLPQSVRQWNGDSRGRWEGKTLVVYTTNFSPQSNYMGSGTNLHLIERFTRIAPGTIKYELTLEDPTTWTKPWTAVILLRQTKDKIYEFACHEGNYDVMVSMLAGARAEQKAAEAAAPPK